MLDAFLCQGVLDGQIKELWGVVASYEYIMTNGATTAAVVVEFGQLEKHRPVLTYWNARLESPRESDDCAFLAAELSPRRQEVEQHPLYATKIEQPSLVIAEAGERPDGGAWSLVPAPRPLVSSS